MQTPVPFPTLETERLLLREIVPADAHELFAIHGDEALMRWFGVDPLQDVAGAEKLITTFASWRAQPNPGTRWGIQRKGEQRLCGTCGLFGWNRAWRKCTVGYELAAHAQGKGYMHEALTSMLDWGFTNMELNRVEAQAHAENTASLRSLSRLGFRQEGLLRELGYWRGGYHDLLGFSLLRRDWESRHGEDGLRVSALAVAAVLVHVPEVEAALAWYQSAFPDAVRRRIEDFDVDSLTVGGVQLEIVPADDKVAAGAAGCVVYWRVAQFEDALAHMEAIGATLYRGPMAIEQGQRMCQLRDPWGNCIGLRGPARSA
jgi:ribosomal-protein-alanine N-acetyltransferase